VPDEVGVGNLDDLVTELEVDGALDVGDRAIDVHISAAIGLRGRESGDDLVEDGSGQGADSVAAVKEDGLGGCSRESGVDGAVLLNETDTIEVDPVSGIVSLWGSIWVRE
jgi:hypothetical protein